MRKKSEGLIVNADDFGQTESCTRAISEAFAKGLITDTTMVANGEAMSMAFAFIRSCPGIRDNVGIHFILTEGRPLTEGIKGNPKFVTDGSFNSYFQDKKAYFRRLTRRDKRDIYEELTAQIEYLLSEGVLLTHADSHHHIHYNWQVAPIVFRVCREHSITKLRIHRNVDRRSIFWNVFYGFLYNFRLRIHGFSHTDYFGSVGEYGHKMSGISEIMVHPDYDAKGKLIDRRQKKHDKNGRAYAVGEELGKALVSHLSEAEPITYRSI